MNAAVPKINPKPNFYQNNLIPSDSCKVRYAMKKAKQFGSSDNPLEAHIVSVAFAISAIAMSFFNIISYILLIPCQMLVNIVSYSPIKFFTDIAGDITSAAKSVLFLSLGVTFIVGGILFPDAIFSHFEPEYDNPIEVRLKNQIATLEKRCTKLENELKKAGEMADVDAAAIQDLERRLEGRRFWCFR